MNPSPGAGDEVINPVPSHPHPNPGCCRDLLSSHCNNGRNWISFRSDSPAFPKISHSRFDQTKFSSWSLIPASFGRCFHAILARLMPIVQRKCITKLVSHFKNSINCYYLHINILLEFYFVLTAESWIKGLDMDKRQVHVPGALWSGFRIGCNRDCFTLSFQTVGILHISAIISP